MISTNPSSGLGTPLRVVFDTVEALFAGLQNHAILRAESFVRD